MSALQELSVRQITECIALAVSKLAPVAITIRQDNNWINYHSQMLAVTADRLVIELPAMEAGVPPHEFVPAEKIGLSFKLKHHKHLSTATVAGVVDWPIGGGNTCRAIGVCLPTKMQRLQRRAYFRADVPANRVVRAAFWLGGRDAEPQGTTLTLPVWSGRVTNLSAGGFQLVCGLESVAPLEVGETVGIRLAFGAGDGTVYADAQFRHICRDHDEAVMGFQFLGLAQTNEGKDALKVISRKVSEYQQVAQEGCRL